ncbi:YibE/F family protein [Lachnospiraceae bacterium OttesenSCG-928-J05]|nr:YibE/F family protein [Lachnospiraceae bacterium OttesenSCG-928-J05]
MKNKHFLPIVLYGLIAIILLLLPTGYEGAKVNDSAIRVKAEVLSTNDGNILTSGIVQHGEQSCQVKILKGKYKGEVVDAVNTLNGSLEQDKIFKAGEKALVMISQKADKIVSVSMIDHYRIHYEVLLLLGFFIFLVVFAGPVGVRTMLSFILTLLMIWKLLIPAYLKGFNPLIVGGVIVAFLTLAIISLVYGFDKRCLAAIIGSVSGLLVTCIMGIIATKMFALNGAVMAYSESLLYSGFEYLNLTEIFIASIYIGASGAVMDLSVDITSAVHEVIMRRPDITRKEAVRSGINVGRDTMGTMTTTLLLAYSGGFVALLMVFMAQGTPIVNILNYKYVAAEIIHTLVGSFGLVTVAPLTALSAGLVLASNKN